MDFTYPGLFNQYSSQVLLNDMTGMNLYPPMGFTMGYDYGMGMDSSIFNCSPYNMGGYMMPFTGNYEQYDKYQKQLIHLVVDLKFHHHNEIHYDYIHHIIQEKN